MDRLTVIGGSSPFTLGLIDALLDASRLLPQELVLHGRNRERLDLVRGYAASRLEHAGWKIAATTNLSEALAGACFIIHQPRYGDLDGRAEDERLAARFGAVVDETLGPGALNSALRMAPSLRDVARTITAVASDAWVLNLTNPLSIAMVILAQEGVKRCIGLCELPLATARIIARLLRLPLDRLSWRYRGFNHRGFLVELGSEGVDQLPVLLTRLRGETLNGISGETIAVLDAVPTKYFRLTQQGGYPAPHRAAYVGALGHRILRELRTVPHAAPPSLHLRQLPWYAESLVPALSSLQSNSPSRHVINLYCPDGLAREMHASLSTSGAVPEPSPDVSFQVGRHLEQFEEHERRTLEAVSNPSVASIEAALEADPTVDPGAIPELVNALWSRHAARTAEAAAM